VAKWLRQWVVIPPFAGSSPVVRPIIVVKPFDVVLQDQKIYPNDLLK
tara:strand:- start:13 stop:153 length:141 start_codon:yes stop_codon:yes gene_type:complete